MKFKRSKEFSIGLSVIVALVVVYFGIEYLKGNNIFKAANYYYATYTDVAGLAQSAPVTINGYKVGLVREIEYEYNNPGHIKVEMSLDKELRLPKGTKAVLATDMLGTSTIELHLAPGTDYHPVGDMLIGEQSSSLMGAVTNNILPAVGEIMPKIDTLLTSLNAVVSDPALHSSMVYLQSAMANIEASSKRLNEVMNTMPALAGDARSVMTNVKTMSASLNTIATDLTKVSGQLKEMPLSATMDNLYQTSNNLKTLISQLNSPDSSLGLLLNDPQLYKNLTGASASLDSLLIDVKKNPKRYISIKLL
ncbi:MAG: MlaD family protein [Paramuribaculum sp.]|nr:MlaD family protein [Paramuribaculum sp.]